MSLNLATLLRQSAAAAPERTALVCGDAELSYRAVHDLAGRFAGALRALGVRPGQHVALLLPNVPSFTLAYFGAHYAGCPVVPLNVLFRPDEIAYHLEDSDAVALVVWEGLLPQAEEAFRRVATCKHLIACRADARDLQAPQNVEGGHNLMALLGEAAPVTDLPATMPDDTAVLLYTSGTTGRPKGAELSHFNMLHNAEYTATRLLRLSEETVALCCLPLFHSFGQTVMHNATLSAGGTVVLMPRFEPQAALQLMERRKVSFFGGVPTMYFALLHQPGAERHDLSALRFCVCGGAPMPVEVMRAFDERHGVSILEGYGLSETSPVASFNVLDRPKKPGSIGLPLRGVEFRLIDDGGADVGAGEPGEICIKGPNVMKGYYKRPEATAEVLRDGWFRTGDIGVRDEDGSYRIVDRKKDLIIRGGFNVYPREVEEVLYAHPAIAEAAVIGVPSESHGEEVKAVLACKPGHAATAEEIMGYCREHLAAFKCPRLVEFRDALPKGPTGKILKRELKD
jgi:long-chain acyl-CoA synthetase